MLAEAVRAKAALAAFRHALVRIQALAHDLVRLVLVRYVAVLRRAARVVDLVVGVPLGG